VIIQHLLDSCTDNIGITILPVSLMAKAGAIDSLMWLIQVNVNILCKKWVAA
jgi:hypothetical protein